MPKDTSPRPYLVITTLYRPQQGVRTSTRGWADQHRNWDSFEQCAVVDRLSSNTLRDATVIIDIEKRVVVKNRYDLTESDQVVQHYLTRFADEVAHGRRMFTLRHPGT